LKPSAHHPSTHAATMADFRQRTIAPMRETAASMRRTIEQSLRTIEASRTALGRANELARAADDALAHWRRREDIN